MARRSKGPDYWRQVISEFEASGLSQAAFIAERGLKKTTFSKWWRRFRAAPRGPGGRRPGAVRLLEVEVVTEPPPPSHMLELSWPTGCSLRFEVGADPNYVADLAAALGRRLRC